MLDDQSGVDRPGKDGGDSFGDLFDVDQSGAVWNVDQQVDIGCLGGGPACDRAEDSHVRAAEPTDGGDDLVANGTERIERRRLPARFGADDKLVARCVEEALEHLHGRVDLTALDPRHRRCRDATPRCEITCGQTGAPTIAGASSVPSSSSVSVTPVRILDTRTGVGLSGPFVSPTGRSVQVTGTVATSSGLEVVVPDGATAVVLNVTPVLPQADCAGSYAAPTAPPGKVWLYLDFSTKVKGLTGNSAGSVRDGGFTVFWLGDASGINEIVTITLSWAHTAP